MTQVEMVRKHLDMYGYITPLEAIKEYGILRLASRMADLKRDGYPFRVCMETSLNRFGKKVSYARYEREERDVSVSDTEE